MAKRNRTMKERIEERFGQLPPIPTGKEFSYDYKPEGIILRNIIKERKNAMYLKYIKRNLDKVKKETYDKEMEPFDPDTMKPYHAREDLIKCAEEYPRTPLLEEVKTRIVKMVRPERYQYTGCERDLAEYLSEVNEVLYSDPMHEEAVNRAVTRCGPYQPVQLPPFKLPGRTKYRDQFLKMRQLAHNRLRYVYTSLRDLLSKVVAFLPQNAFDIENFRTERGYTFNQLSDVLESRVSHMFLDMRVNWYQQTRTIMQTHTVNMPSAISLRYNKAAGTLLRSYMAIMILRTVEAFVDMIGDEKRTPFFKIELSFDPRTGNRMDPDLEQLRQYYFQLIDDIMRLSKQLPRVEYTCARGESQEPCIELTIPLSFVCRIRYQLTENLKRVFQPLEDHISNLVTEFAPLYDLTTQEDLLTNDDLSFDKGYELIELYRAQLKKVKFLQPEMKFNVGKVDQSCLVMALTQVAQSSIDGMSARTVELLYINMGDILEMYEFLRMKAETVPYSTGELLELSKYMLWVSTTHVHDLYERTANAVRDLLRLLDVAYVPIRCFKRLNRAMQWIFEVPGLLEENASMLERVKFDLEESLQKKVEKLNTEIRGITPVLEIFDYMDDADRAREYLKDMRRILKHIQVLDQLQMWINHEETLFKFPASSYPELEELKRYIAPFFRLVYVCMKWRRCYNVWMDGPFENLQVELVEETVDGFYKELQKTGKAFRNKIKQMIADNNPRRFKGIVDDPDPLNLPAPLKLCTKAMQQIKDFRPNITVISIFCSTSLYQRHWDEMSEIAGYDITPNAGTTLRKLVDRGLGPQLDKYEIISTGAVKERQLYLNLQKMMTEWEDIRFKTSTYKETGITILSGLDDIQAVLEDHIIKTLTLRGSVFVKYYEESVKAWYEKVTRMNNTLEEWGKVQSQWLYLLPIFSSEDIIAQMPEEGVLFKQVDNTYRRYMSAVEKDDHVLATAGSVGMLEAMIECTDLLDQINEGVSNYLEKKRLFFSRFFFLSNDEMLEILSETKDPLRVQPHLRKCFEGINKLEFNKELEILGMYSQEGEQIEIVTTINTEAAHGSVEKWLVQVEEQMVISVRHKIELSFEDYKHKARTDWVKRWPGQVILAISQVYWTANVHRCLNAEMEGNLVDFHVELTSQLQDIVDLVRSPEITNLIRITIKALIVLDVHAKDVVKELINKNVQFENEFKWLAQLRYYWTDNCLVRMINATIPYAYEYLGNSDRLVITPLTDRCYRTLIGAYHLHLNGAPEGPAGTGKTETTKDLAKALAVQCVVFNCSDGLDYKAMGKFFKGLASSGAWACFDEFNRIEIEVLSVVAQQILSIVLAVRANLTKFVFEGTELVLNPSVYICITMNPGYAGRSELPDNLKVLFRTVAMMVPDYAMIGEISLYSYGFKNARTLAVKIVTTYKLCSEQLSSQNHYDYGMRAVKTVLSACGNIKRKFPNENEDILLLRSLIDVNLPKFLTHDVPLFQGIISDLFPGVVLPQPNYEDITNACETACESKNLQPREIFLEKIIQTYEMMIVRHGFMLVGDPFSGKTSTLKILADALRIMSERGLDQVPVNYQFINPKSITMGQLYGQFDPVSYEWTDGIVATCYRQFALDISGDRNWVIFDGPVDAVWIENMNTVLDDNKKLCLTSGEVISMTNKMSMIFEVMDLAQASPATVSRCGMIYMESANLGWRPFFESWLNKANPEWTEENQTLIITLFDWAIPACLQFVKKHCVQYVYPGDVNISLSTMEIMEMLLNDACVEFPDESRQLVPWIQATLMLAISWGLAGILDAESRLKFDEYHKELWKGNNLDYPFPDTEKLEVPIPAEGLLMEYLYIFKTPKGSWKYWPDIVRQQKINDMGSMLQIIIPTVDTVRYMYMVELLIRHNKSVLLVGPTGTGKSFYMQDLLMNSLDQELCEPSFLTFTAQTQANQTQDLVISKLVKGKRGNFGAPAGKRSIIFIDDINMPAKEVYGAQPPIELIRQFFDHQHWYNLKDTTKIFLHNILFVAAMGLVGGSRQDLYARFLRHFTIFSINDFSEESMVKIFSNVLLIALKRNGFATDVMANVQCIVSATLDLFKDANTDLLPTPAKSHYIFNLRDFSRVIQGCGMLKKDSAENKKIFAKLWVHESLRVFNDRLIDDNDKHWLFMKLQQCVSDHFKDRFEMLFDNLKNEEKQVTQVELQNLMFGTYLDLDAPEEERKYEEIESLDVLKEIALNYLDEYNSTHKTKMDIVLFKFALEHLSKLCRILSMPRGSALLVGIGGSGRQSLTRLATTICGHNFFQPEITKNYGLNEFRDDIKLVLKQSGGLGKHTVFLFTEDQLKEDSFLQDIDSLLNSGEVPNLYAIDEKQEILELVRLAAQGGNRNLDISPLAVFAFFTNRCREKLHIVLSFSPIGSSFRSRLRLYPSLVSCCTIDWYEAWPEDALEAVAHNWMKDLSVTPEVQAAAINACKYFHICARNISETFYQQSMRRSYITSASYLNLIISYQVLINKKQHEIMQAKHRYLSGLEKLEFAADQVSVMQVSLEELQPQLAAMTERATAMLKEIERETKEAEYASMLVREDEKVANVQAARAMSLKAECEADLAQAIPILEEAIEALNTLKPADITLVKSMKNPPAAIKLVMAAVCVIKDVKPDRVPNPATGRMQLDYWGPSKKILGEMNFLQQLKEFDKDNIPIAVMQRIRKEYLPQKDFKPEVVAKASSAAEGLCKWIIAMDLYDAVAREVAPKKEKLEMAEAEYNSTMAILQEKRNQVERLEKRVNDLKEQLLSAESEQARLREEVELCSEKLARAKKLIGGLGGEKNRWLQAAEDLQRQYDDLPGNILVSCGVIAYLAPYTIQYRIEAIKDWLGFCKKHNIPCSQDFDFCEVLGSEVETQAWYISGLPRDEFSTQNAIIQNTSQRWSLLIDPQLQANKWIKEHEKQNYLSIVKLTDPNYMKVIENCIEFGMPVLIENILETLDPPLDPLLQKKTFKQGGELVISLGDNVIHYDDKFRMYLTSKLRNPHYLPEVFNKVTVVNFSLTAEGLEDQLLGIVVTYEKTELQQQKERLVVESAENKAALKNVEDSILKTLSESKGNILEDEKAIEVLDYSKSLAADITSRQAITKKTEKEIEKYREMYRPVAAYSTALYYTISDLPHVDPMYQYSLNWFLNLYRTSIVNSRKSKDLDERMENIKTLFTYNLYSNICRSLFEKDKLLYSFVLCTKIMIFQNELSDQYYRFFLTGGFNIENTIENPAPDWISQKQWDEFCRLSDLPSFTGFADHLKHNLSAWYKFYDSAQPELLKQPEPWESKLSAFDKLMIFKIIRPDKLLEKMTLFISSIMGDDFVKPPPFDLWKSYSDSNKLRPLIFILSPGMDPMLPLNKLAEKMSLSERFSSISLGQGQGPIAEEMIAIAMQEGTWVCLQNCHLALSWMPQLEKLYEGMDFQNTHESFRLWLTSYPTDKFPVSILQNGVKMTNEPPTALQQNLLHMFSSEPIKDPQFMFSVPAKEKIFCKIIYALCFFHAVIQERRTFGPLGWNIPYGFNDSDLHISIQQVQMFMNEYKEVPYEALLYLIGECNYGGRVTDDWDRRLIATILETYISKYSIEADTSSLLAVSQTNEMDDFSDQNFFLKHINDMPTFQPPEVFGLHSNAGITRALQNTSIMLTSLLNLQGEAASAGEAMETLLLKLSSEILAKLPPAFDMEAAKQKYPVDYAESMNTVLVQELDRFNRLLNRIRTSLVVLEKAVQGLIVMTPDLDVLANSLLLSRIPALWAQVSYPSLKSLPAYVSDFIERIQFLRNWYENGKPTTFWLSGFFFTHAFLTGAKQNHARSKKIPIDQLDFDHEIMHSDFENTASSLGVFVNGLFVDGARWNRSKHCLDEQLPRVLSDVLPVIWLKPIIIEDFRDRGRYKSPVYKTSERRGVLSTTGHSTNYVLPIYLDTKQNPAHWIKRSVALLCQLD